MENRSSSGLSLTISTSSGTEVTLELAPGQALQVTAGEATARVLLGSGRVDDLLVVRPGQAS